MKKSFSKKNIGRNDPCPCGSGKKYKKCCLDKNHFSDIDFFPEELERLITEFKQYDKFKLLSFLSSLQLYPKNHNQLLRLELISLLALISDESSAKDIDYNYLVEKLNENIPSDGSIGSLEDPSENLFTENIVFFGGNHIIYPGIISKGAYILNTLIKAIFKNKQNFPEDFIKQTYEVTKSLLTLSSTISHRLGQKRNMVSPDRWHDKILLPPKKDINKYLNAAVFSENDIHKHFASLGLSIDTLNPFILSNENIKVSENYLENNPLFIKPIIKLHDKFIICLPCSISSSLRHYIFTLAKRMNIIDILAKKYRETVWKELLENLKLLDFSKTDLEIPSGECKSMINEGFFKIDDDKIAYINLIVDDASNYNENEIFGHWEVKDLKNVVEKRNESIVNWLINQKKYNCKEVLIITVLDLIGRYIFFGINSIPKNSRMILLSLEDFQTVSSLRKYNSLNLWKYAGAEDKFINTTKLVSFSFLDKFSFYLDHNHSFYVTDDRLPNLVNLVSGYGHNLRIKVTKMWDKHAVLYNDKNYVEIFKYYEEDIPIHMMEGSIGRNFEQVIEGYKQPIWIKCNENNNEFWELYFDFTNMLSYWIWQIIPSLYKHLALLDLKFIRIIFKLENVEKWDQFKSNLNDKEETELKFTKTISGNNITFTIPAGIQKFLYPSNNEGERIILQELLESFRLLLNDNDIYKKLENKEILDIVNRHAPLGLKKKLIFIETNINPSLNPKNISTLRKLQDHDLESQLDDLAQKIGDKCPPIGKIIKKVDKIKLCNHIVDYYLSQIKLYLNVYSWKSLMEKLISQNEAVWHYRALKNINAPTSIECFSDIKTFVNDMLNEFPLIDSTAFAIRTLIEIVSSELSKGKEKISTDSLDQLLAMTHHLINWGFISDDIHLGVIDIGMSVLNSGRIGTEKENIKDIRESFLKAKIYEGVELSINSFENYFNQRKDLNNKFDEFEIAFLKEFGLSMTKIIDFLNTIAYLGFEMESVTPSMNLSELKKYLSNKLKWTEKEINTAIDLFSLKSRNSWEIPPQGFTEKDIQPWIYNRQLSFIRRPLIIIPVPENDPIVYWGPRHTFESCKYLLSLIETGRYKLTDKSSVEMEKLIHKIQGEAGKIFVTIVSDWFKQFDNIQVDINIPIKKDALLNSEKNLGDIDILIIDKIKKKVFSIECKNTNYARNPREIANEIKQFSEGKDRKNSWLSKHIKRDYWLQNNKRILKSAFKLESEEFVIKSLFIVAEEIISTFLLDISLPVISFSSLKRQGIKLFDNI